MPHAPPCNPGGSDTLNASQWEATVGEVKAGGSRRGSTSASASMQQERRRSLRMKKLVGLGLIDRYGLMAARMHRPVVIKLGLMFSHIDDTLSQQHKRKPEQEV